MRLRPIRLSLAANVLAGIVMPAIVEPVRATEGPGLLSEPAPITKAVDLFNRKVSSGKQEEPKPGFYIAFGDMIPGAGWIAVGPGYRWRVSERATVTTSALVSWRLYSTAQARLDVRHDRVSVGAQIQYQDALQINFYGVGNDTKPSARTGYRLRSTDVSTYATVRSGRWAAAGRVGWTPNVNMLEMAGRLPEYSSAQRVFDETSAPGLSHQFPFAHADVSVMADSRDEPGHPTRGTLYRLGAQRYQPTGGSTGGFTIYEGESAGYWPIAGKTWVLAARAWLATTRAGSGTTVPVYLLPNIGGKYAMRGYPDYRFTDRSVGVLAFESRWALFDHLDVALFSEAGRVWHRTAELGHGDLKRSTGIGLRLHSGALMIFRFDAASSREGWHAILTASAPLRRKTFAGNHPSILPFVP